MGFRGFYWVLLGLTTLIPGVIRVYWVLLGLSRLLGNSAGLDYVAVIEPAGNVASHDVT